MPSSQVVDYYETLQISPNAEPETVHRVFRLLAQRFHPDNAETGNEAQFRVLNEAYRVLSDPEQRARYDIVHTGLRQERWRLVASASESENNFDAERGVRLTVLEVLYTRTEDMSVPSPTDAASYRRVLGTDTASRSPFTERHSERISH